MIHLGPVRGVRVDPVGRTARVGAGALLGDLDREAQSFGLVTTAGTVSHTGTAGLTLGGGFGRLARKFGLTCDNLISADLITASGEFLRVSARENPDLFWGIRGGGGNFGIVTSFLFQLHPLRTVYAGPMLWPLERATAVMQFYRDFMTQAPKKKTRWWWRPMELLGFQKEEPKPKVTPLQSAQQFTRPLPGKATGTYRGVQ